MLIRPTTYADMEALFLPLPTPYFTYNLRYHSVTTSKVF